MLVLSRKINETIVIGSGDAQIEITVVDVDNGRVKIGIKAPRHVVIDRLEIRDKKAMEQQRLRETVGVE